MADAKPSTSETLELEAFNDDSYLEQYAPPDTSKFVGRITIALGESFGTGILVFILCMGCTDGMQGGEISHLQKCIAGGLAIMSAVMISGHISGSHVNPAVTVSAMIMGETEPVNGAIYMVSQLMGGTAGYALITLMTPKKYLSDAHCITVPSEEITIYQALAVEVTITFILTLACCALWDRRNSNKGDSVAIRLGLLVLVLALVAGPYTGASMNPARSLAPAIINQNFKQQWIYILAPCVGGALSGLLHKKIFQ